MTANLDPATRARLADALDGATVEQLRRDAEYILGLVDDYAAARLAALALAVAEMQERGLATFGCTEGYVIEDSDLATYVVGGPTLPAALASLLRSGER